MTPLLRPLLRSWAHSRIAAAPADAPPAGDPVVVVPGADPDRVLLLGAGPAASPGAAEWSAGVPGALAAALSALTGRGAVVEARGAHRAGIADLPGLARSARLQRFDALLVCVGLDDGAAGAAAGRWRRALGAFVDELRGGGAKGATIVLVEIPPASSVGVYRGAPAVLADWNIRRLNRAILRVAAERDGVLTAPAPTPGPDAPVGSPHWFEHCGTLFAARLHPALRGSVGDAGS